MSQHAAVHWQDQQAQLSSHTLCVSEQHPQPDGHGHQNLEPRHKGTSSPHEGSAHQAMRHDSAPPPCGFWFGCCTYMPCGGGGGGYPCYGRHPLIYVPRVNQGLRCDAVMPGWLKCLKHVYRPSACISKLFALSAQQALLARQIPHVHILHTVQGFHLVLLGWRLAVWLLRVAALTVRALLLPVLLRREALVVPLRRAARKACSAV